MVALAATAQPLFEDIWTVQSKNGVLEVFLVDEVSNVTLGEYTLELRVWNKSMTGPLLKCKRGDTIKIYLLNKLDQVTNLHFHGFHVTPKIPGDDARFMLPNNNKVKMYEFTIPMNHPQGMFWYHSHAMPFSEWQIFNGMSGPFIVEGLLDPLPELSTVVEKTVLLRDMQIVDGAVPSQLDFVGEAPTIRFVNHQIFPNLSCPVNETQLWSIANIGADISYLLAWERPDGSFADEIGLWFVAWDGILMNNKVPITNEFYLGPGNRVQILVRCPSAPVDIKMVTRKFSNGIPTDEFPTTDLIRVDVSGVARNAISDLNVTFPALKDYRQSDVSAERNVVFTQGAEEEEAPVVPGGEVEGSFFINGKPFSKARVDVRTFLGSVERWFIINRSPEFHYFHIHQGHFQVVAVDGVPVPFHGYMDTVFVDRPQNGSAEVVVEIIIPFTNPDQVGKYSFHCHIEGHADGGMMATLEVIDSPKLDVVFVAIAIPVLFIILVASSGFLFYQWRQDQKASKTLLPTSQEDETKQ